MSKPAYFVSLSLIVSAGALWFFQSRALERQQSLVAAEQHRIAQWREQLSHLRQQRDEASGAALVEEREALKLSSARDSTHDPAAGTEEDSEAWLTRAKKLRQSFIDDPTQTVPELRLLGDLDWLKVARTASDHSELTLRKARAAARTIAIRRFCVQLGAALSAYTQAHDFELPGEVAQLLPFFSPPIAPDLLERYTITATGNARTMRREAIAERSPIDEEFDPRHAISAGGNVSSSASWAEAIFNNAGFQSGDAYALANGGQKAKTADDLLPYVQDPGLRPIFTAIAAFRKSQSKFTYRFADLRPYVIDPAASAFLEKLIVAEQKRSPP